MQAKIIIKKFVPAELINWYRRKKNHVGIVRWRFNSEDASEVKIDIQKKYKHDSELLNIFANIHGVKMHKWHHYIPLYDRYFSAYRGRPIRFLEIGVSKGGSLQMWRKYFGVDAIIFGIDINPECGKLNGSDGQVRIGSQTDRGFLESVVNEMGGVDIILDDGSHHMEHVPTTLKYLFPHLNHGGLYLIEDLHTAYWRSYGGGYQSKNNFFKFAMDLVHDMHHWYHAKKITQRSISKDCTGIHIHDSILVLEKNKVFEPVHSEMGKAL